MHLREFHIFSNINTSLCIFIILIYILFSCAFIFINTLLCFSCFFTHFTYFPFYFIYAHYIINNDNASVPESPSELLPLNWTYPSKEVGHSPLLFLEFVDPWLFISNFTQVQFSSVQSLSCVRLFATPLTVACQASLSITNSRSLLKLMSAQSVMSFNHFILCCPLLLPSIFPSIRVFSKESVLCIRGPKYWSFSFNISPSNEYSGLISFRIDWFALLAVQGTLKSLLQHFTSKASVLWHSAFFMVQLSHPYVTAGKTRPLTIWTFVSKVMSLLFRMLSRLVTTYLPRSKHFLISWLQSPSAVILEPKKIKSNTVFIDSPLTNWVRWIQGFLTSKQLYFFFDLF